jgi:hypothetical protein
MSPTDSSTRSNTINTNSNSAVAEKIPVILSGHALRSLRDSGYDLPTALGEVIDNSIEAEANNINVRLQEEMQKAKKRHIHRIIISDDGRGMEATTLQHYPQLGFSTRYMSKTTIGKYGVGAKLAALNFGKRLDVWSRRAAAEPWLHVYFDLEEAEEAETRGETPVIDAPLADSVPDELNAYFPVGAGTVVIWSKVDRLEDGRRAPDANELRLEVERELSRIFRRFLNGGIKIRVNETELLPHDPTFLMNGTWSDQKLSTIAARSDGGAARDHFPAEMLFEEVIKVAGAEAVLRVTLYPPEVTRKRGLGGDQLAKDLRVPDNEGAISFVRLNREINYTNVPRLFPFGVKHVDRFIGIEVEFNPEHDDFFGVRNVKRGVEPHDQLRAEIAKKLRKPIEEARRQIEERWGEMARRDMVHAGEHIAPAEAAKEVNRTLPKARAGADDSAADVAKALDVLAHDAGHSADEERKAYLERVQDLPFVVESVDFPGTNFIEVQHVAGKVLIRINTRHPFYRTVWEPLRRIADGTAGAMSPEDVAGTARSATEALTHLLIAYGKAESMHENPHEQYADLRAYWGQFLGTLLSKGRRAA